MLKSILATMVLVVTAAAQAGTAPAAPAPLAPTVSPEDISYSNLSLSYQYMNAGQGLLDFSSHGVALGLEYSPAEHLYISLGGSYNDGDAEFFLGSAEFEYWTFNAGLGGYVAISENVHFVTEVGAHYGDFNLGAIDVNNWGIYVTPHFRIKSGALETHIGVNYNANDISFTQWSAFVRAFYGVTSNIDLFAGFLVGFGEADFDDQFGVNVGLRFKF